MDRGETPQIGPHAASSVSAADSDEPVRHNGSEPPPHRIDRIALLERSGLDAQALAALESAGLIVPAATGWYDQDSLAIAEVAAAFFEYGLEPRHLRAYRAAADREVGMIAAIVAPLARASTPSGRARAREATLELTALSQRLHAALVRAGLRETLGG
jgi:hypothetical protein